MSIITQYGTFALMEATKWGRNEVVSLLLKAGAKTDQKNEVENNNRQCVRSLIGLYTGWKVSIDFCCRI